MVSTFSKQNLNFISTCHSDVPKHKNSLLYISIFAVWFLIIGKYFVRLNIPVEVFTIVILSFAIFLRQDQLVGLIVFSIPYVSVFKTGITNALLILIWLIKELYTNKNFKICFTNKLVVLMMFFCVFELLHLFYLPFSFTDYIKVFVLYFFLGLIFDADLRKYDSKVIITAFVTGVLSFSILLLLYDLKTTNYSLESIVTFIRRFGYDVENTTISFDSLKISPNYLALCCAFTISLELVLMLNKKNIWPRLIIVGLLLFFGLLTQSKAFFVIILIILLMLGIHYLKTKSFMKILLFAVAISIFVLFILYSNGILSDLFDSIINRFNEGNGLSSRDTLFVDYLDYIVGKPFEFIFGIGTQSQNIKTGIEKNPHSMFIEVLVSWGIIGVFAVFVFLAFILKKYERNLLDYRNLPLYVFVMMTQSSRLFKNQHTMCFFLVIIFAYELSITAKLNGKNVRK